MTVEALKRDGRVPVRVSPFYIFLLRDGTVISISASPSGQALTAPIAARLRERDTLLRKSADPSLLVQSLLDLLVDKGLEVIDAFHDRITQFEREVLLKPKMRTVRNLHIISGDLILHKRTLEPIKTVIGAIPNYGDLADVDHDDHGAPPRGSCSHGLFSSTRPNFLSELRTALYLSAMVLFFTSTGTSPVQTISV